MCMKKMMLAFTVLAVCISCKKEETTPPGDTGCKISNSTLVGTYVKTAVKYKASSSAAEQDLFSGLQPCEQDDTYELKADYSVVVGDGAEVCPGPPPPGGVTAWTISADGKVFTLDEIYDVTSFDCTTLVVTQTNYFVTGDIRTVTYKKK